MSHSSVVQPGSSSSRPKATRLTREGSLYLTNFVHTVTAYPSRPQKEDLLATLRSIPGNEHFTYQKLCTWFSRHRNVSGDSNGPDEEMILFPKLTPHFWQLRTLYKKRPDPTDSMVDIWVTRLGVEKSDIVTWIQYQQAKAKEDQVCATPESPEIPLQQMVGEHDRGSASVSPTMSEFPRPHLPTPAKSPSVSPQTRMPSLPPIAVKVEEPRQCLSPVSSLGAPSFYKPRQDEPTESPSLLEGLPPLSRLVRQHKPTLASPSVPVQQRDLNQMLVASIRNSLRPDPTASEPPPRTVDEFANKFVKVEKMIESFVHRFDSGQLEQLGWDSSLNKPSVS